MMTVDNVKKAIKMLAANYGENFYKGTNPSDVLETWMMQFANDDPESVMRAVENCINTSGYRPTIYDIRKRMTKSRMQGQMTATEAFQAISRAVDESYDKQSATKVYNELPPILRKLVGYPGMLIHWHHVSEDSFHTVIMSAIRESYRELAQQELEYNALPEYIKKSEGWMVEAPEQVALPEPKKPETMDEILDRMDAEARAYREKYGITLKSDCSDKVNAFKAPLTEEDKKRVELREKQKSEWSLK